MGILSDMTPRQRVRKELGNRLWGKTVSLSTYTYTERSQDVCLICIPTHLNRIPKGISQSERQIFFVWAVLGFKHYILFCLFVFHFFKKLLLTLHINPSFPPLLLPSHLIPFLSPTHSSEAFFAESATTGIPTWGRNKPLSHIKIKKVIPPKRQFMHLWTILVWLPGPLSNRSRLTIVTHFKSV